VTTKPDILERFSHCHSVMVTAQDWGYVKVAVEPAAFPETVPIEAVVHEIGAARKDPVVPVGINTPLRQIQQLLGHSSLATTQIYLDVTAADLEQAITALDTLSG
jgi:hypothetical protein